MEAPALSCTYVLLLLPCFFLSVPPSNGYFVINCNIRGSLKHPVNLKALCNRRELHDVPRDVPDETRVLDLSSNRLTSINKNDLNHLTKLVHLNVSRNQIQAIEGGAFRSLTALQELNLAYNQLTSISRGSFQNLFNLTVLRLDYNRITNISASAFDPLISLVLLNLMGNHLSYVYETQPLFQLLKIQELYIARNNFSSFETSQVSNTSLKLKVLDLSGNPLHTFRITADVFPHLESLGLAFSNGSMAWDVQDTTYLRNVSTLNLTGIEKTSHEMESVLQTFNTSLINLSLYQLREKTVKPIIKTACLINTLRTLYLLSNNMISISETELTDCTNIVTLDLSENTLKNITNLAFRPMKNLKRLSLSRNKLDSVPPAVRNLSSLEVLDLSYNSIDTITCSDFNNLAQLQTLYIHRNPLSSIEVCSFPSLQNLIINSSRLISVTNCFKTPLQELELLDLRQNKLNYIHKGDFSGLTSLTRLLLNENQISTIEEGAFDKLRNLSELNLQSNKITSSSIKASVFSGLTNLKYLLLNNNYLSYSYQSALVDPPFKNFMTLDTLAIHSQGHRGMMNLPSNFLEGLASLRVFTAGNLALNFLQPDTFSHTPGLLSLDLSRNEITPVSPELFRPLQSLNTLYMSSAGLQSLDFLMRANLTQMRYLQISKNALAVINKTIITSFADLTYIDLQGNPFSCDCSNAWFVNWAIKKNDTQVINADQLMCNYPPKLRGNKIMQLDFDSCTVDKGFFCFISTTVSILLITLGSIAYHFLKWQVVYAYYRLLAFLHNNNQQRKGQPIGFQYDAFISYNTHDELWVMSELLPQVEREQGWRLCLHHRDFQPGKTIMDNIVDGIYSSRKTICVISRHYLESEWCSREIQVASFRLFDEKKDVLILVFLENIPAHQLSPYYRMRKLIKKRTYLSWPKPGEDTRVFWEKLRMALESKGTSEEENPILAGLRRTGE